MDQVANGEVSIEDLHQEKRHEAEGVDGEDKKNLHVVSDAGIRGPGSHSPKSPPIMHGIQTSDKEDAGLNNEKLGAIAKHTHLDEGAGLMHEPHEELASHGMHMHDDGHNNIAHDSSKSASTHRKHTSHESDTVVTDKHSANIQVHGTHIHGNEGAEVMQESWENSATRENHLPDDGHAAIADRDNAHGKHLHVRDVQVLTGTGEQPIAYGKQREGADGEHSSAEAKHRLDTEERNTSNTLKGKSPWGQKHLHDFNATGVIHEHRHKHEKHRDDGEKFQSVDDDHESKRAFSDENSSRERVHFSRSSTPDVDTPTQLARNPFSNPKVLKAEGKGICSTERGPGSADGNPETPSTSWAFSARASIAPSKFDHMATLRMTYGAYKESSQGKEGVPLSLV